MPELWEAEWKIDQELAKRLIEGQFPSLAPARVEPFAWGFDNAAFLVNESWVFRFPRRSVALPLIEREIRLLSFIAHRLPLRIPVPEYVGSGSDEFPHAFAGYRLVPGATACRAALDDQQRSNAAEPLADFLKALHTIPVAEATALGVQGDPLGRFDVPMRQAKTRATLDELVASCVLSTEENHRFASTLDAITGVNELPHVLVHGDLYARHLIVDGQCRLTGIIDWGDVHLGHPAADLEVAHSFLPPSARERFRHHYGDVSDATWSLSWFRALGHTASVARFAHRIGDADLARETRWALTNLAEIA